MKKQFLTIVSLMVTAIAVYAGDGNPVVSNGLSEFTNRVTNRVTTPDTRSATTMQQGDYANPLVSDNAKRSWSLDEKFSSIIAIGNIELVLVQENSNMVNIQGLEKYVNELHLKIENGVLRITGRKAYTRNKTVVYVPVQELEKVTLRGNSNITSRGRINSKKLVIRVEGTSSVNVRSSGDIMIDSDHLHDFNYEKSEKSVIIFEKA